MTRSTAIWLTCRDLYLGNVRGCIDHEHNRLGCYDRAKDCDCDHAARWDADECADPYIGRAPANRKGKPSRFGLRLCCRCHGAFERALMVANGYGYDPSEFRRLPMEEQTARRRRFLARAIWVEWHTSGFVADWQPGFRSARAAYWLERIEAERKAVAA